MSYVTGLIEICSFLLLRLRIPSQYFSNEKHFINVLNNSAIIREIHTYGEVVSVNKETKKDDTQHIGFGRKLILKAEEIIKEKYPEIKQIAVISGVGVRDYYRKNGFELKDTYMIKKIED